MTLLRPTILALTSAALLGYSTYSAADVAPQLKKNADILQTILQTAFSNTEQARLTSLQSSYLAGQGLLFQASNKIGASHIFQFNDARVPVAPPPPLPASQFEFEIDSEQLTIITEQAEEMAEQAQQQFRQHHRLFEQQRTIERELRDVEREKRDLEFSQTLTKLDKEQQQELTQLQEKTKQLQQKLAEAAKQAEQSREQLAQQRAKRQAEQEQQTAALVKTVGEQFSQVLCDYGASLRLLPDDEHVTLQLNSRSDAGRYYWVMKKADINQCMAGKIKAADLLAKAKRYQF
ncbi:hypothetical protein [Rheinheimera fenheensis]|uniref:hypothetical protein n=1 Tax=Rheinheimera fenheensis TaxID=3152295 RepID=UPI00325DA5A5